MKKIIGLISNLCKKTRLIPLMLYPYMYLVCIAFGFFVYFIASSFLDKDGVLIATEVMLSIVVLFTLVYHFVLISVCVYYSYTVARGSYPLVEYAKLNLIIKCIHIPGYLLHFMMLFIGMCMSIWGIGFVFLALLVNIGTVFFTAISTFGYIIRMKKLGLISTSCAIVFGFALLFFGADIIIAIACNIIIRSYNKRMQSLSI